MMSDEETNIEVKMEVEENTPQDPLQVSLSQNEDLKNEPVEDADGEHVMNLGPNINQSDGEDDANIPFNVLQACKEEAQSGRKPSGVPIEELHYYTKKSMKYLSKILIDTKRRSIEQTLIDLKPLSLINLQVIKSDVREIFVESYVKRKEIPTLTDFMIKLNAKREDTFYKDIQIQTLVKHDIVHYHHWPTLHRFLLTENPKLAYQRHLYLRQITGYRSKGKSIVYIVVLKALPDKYVAFAVSSTAGVIAKTTCTSDLDVNNVVGSNEIRIWIRSELLPVLSPTAVVVLIQHPKNVKTLSLSSKKEDIIVWLRERDILPHLKEYDSEIESCRKQQPQLLKYRTPPTKSHLYQLYKIHQTKYKEHGFYEQIFASTGFRVLVCIDYPNVIYLHDIWENTSKAGHTLNNINQTLKKLTREEWVMMERKVIEEEKQMMKDDDEMGTIVDNLMQMVKNGDIEAEDFPDGCISTKKDNFDVHIGDVLIV